jgi:hypothetical protein
MPVYVMRLTDGNSIIVLAADEQNARARAATLIVHEGVQIAYCREQSTFAAHFSLNDEGDLETVLWDDPTVGEILENEYPLLNETFKRANAEPFAPGLDATKPIMVQPGWQKSLERADKKNIAIVLEGVRLERVRLDPKKVA